MKPCRLDHSALILESSSKGFDSCTCPDCGDLLYGTFVSATVPPYIVDIKPTGEICTCDVPYEFAPHPCHLHEVPKVAAGPPKKTFKTIKPPPMSDRIPESDAVIAMKSAKLMEDIMTLTNEGSGYTTPENVERATRGIKKRLDALVAAHQRDVELYEEWVRNGKPDLAQ